MPRYRLTRHALARVEVQPSTSCQPREVAEFLTDAGARIDAFFDRWNRSKSLGFFPSDYESIYPILKSLRESYPEATRLCEWGSGFGVIVGLGTILGFESYGIEIDERCVAASRSLLADHGLRGEILEGSFVPEEYAERREGSRDGVGTVLGGPGAIDEVDVGIEDFDLIFAFPWPDEQEMYSDLFARYAAVGAILVTYSALDGIKVRRKVK
jgi:hypothetical protein